MDIETLKRILPEYDNQHEIFRSPVEVSPDQSNQQSHHRAHSREQSPRQDIETISDLFMMAESNNPYVAAIWDELTRRQLEEMRLEDLPKDHIVELNAALASIPMRYRERVKKAHQRFKEVEMELVGNRQHRVYDFLVKKLACTQEKLEHPQAKLACPQEELEFAEVSVAYAQRRVAYAELTLEYTQEKLACAEKKLACAEETQKELVRAQDMLRVAEGALEEKESEVDSFRAALATSKEEVEMYRKAAQGTQVVSKSGSQSNRKLFQEKVGQARELESAEKEIKLLRNRVEALERESKGLKATDEAHGRSIEQLKAQHRVNLEDQEGKLELQAQDRRRKTEEKCAKLEKRLKEKYHVTEACKKVLPKLLDIRRRWALKGMGVNDSLFIQTANNTAHVADLELDLTLLSLKDLSGAAETDTNMFKDIYGFDFTKFLASAEKMRPLLDSPERVKLNSFRETLAGFQSFSPRSLDHSLDSEFKTFLFDMLARWSDHKRDWGATTPSEKEEATKEFWGSPEVKELLETWAPRISAIRAEHRRRYGQVQVLRQ